MSRNVRQKFPRTPVKVNKKRRLSDSSSSSLNLSDDDGYSGVEDVSESDDDDDEHVFAAEEETIISEELKKSSEPSRPVDVEDGDADAEEDDDEDDEVVDDDDAVYESSEWDGNSSDNENTVTEIPFTIFEEEPAPVERHVRFTGVPDSDSDSTTSETSDHEEFFPDIFVDQSILDPGFRHEIERDDDSENSESFWDFHSSSQDLIGAESDDEAGESDDITPTQTPMPTPTVTPMISRAATEVFSPVNFPLNFPSVETNDTLELDGYETDGDTTEEDIPEQPIRPKKQIRRVPVVEASSDSEGDRPLKYRHNKPRVGRFNLDSSTKPIAFMDKRTRKIRIYTPQRSGLDLSPESFNFDFGAQDLTSPILTNPGYVMMGAMFSSNTFGDFLNTQPVGPTEAFFPCTSDALTGEDSDDSEAYVQQEDDEEGALQIEDFITYDSSSEEEGSGADWNGDIESSPTRPKTATSGVSAASNASMDIHPLLSHFDNNSNAVGAFRRNQINQQLISSNKATQESLAFSSTIHYGTLRGIKSGSLETVTAPITPARRHKSDTMVGFNGFSDLQGTPLNNLLQKRKASNGLTGNSHKRHRSVPDMDALAI